VPVALPGLLAAQRRWGRLPLEALVEPAIDLGRRGYVLGPVLAFVFSLLEAIVRRTPECAALFTVDGALGRAGMRLYNRELADVLERVAREPATVSELYAALAQEHGPARGGLITAEDLQAVEPLEEAPLRTQAGAWTLRTMPAPSSGGVLVAVGLRLLEGVGRRPFLSPEHLRTIAAAQVELARLRDATFDEHCRDRAFLEALLDERRVAVLRARAQTNAEAESVLGSTTHISALDEHGAVASLTMTNGEGSGHVLPGTGIHVNNLLGEDDIHPRGFHVDAPGTRLTTMMAPTVLDGPGGTVALGSGGSNRLRSAILCVVSHLVEHGVEPSVAVDAARLHVQAEDAGLRLAFERAGLEEAAVQALRAACPGRSVTFDDKSMYFGGVHVAVRTERGFTGAGDARRGGSVHVVS
jgi:gamma-glutamyltranspeptidase/glutathione hydrolase